MLYKMSSALKGQFGKLPLEQQGNLLELAGTQHDQSGVSSVFIIPRAQTLGLHCTLVARHIFEAVIHVG